MLNIGVFTKSKMWSSSRQIPKNNVWGTVRNAQRSSIWDSRQIPKTICEELSGTYTENKKHLEGGDLVKLTAFCFLSPNLSVRCCLWMCICLWN